MNYRPCFFFILLMIALFCPHNAYATRSSSVELQCPVCNNSLRGSELMSTNNFGGIDSDFMQRPMGASPILIRPNTCLKCGFSGYIDDFSEEAKKKMPATFTSAIMQDKVLKPMVDLASYTDQARVPAWAKYDLIAQVRKLENAPAGDIAHQYLCAAWSVRINVYLPFPEERFEKMSAYFDANFSGRFDKRDRNAATVNIEVAFDALKMSEKPEENDVVSALVGAVWLFHQYGENPVALKAMKRLSPLLASEAAKLVEEKLNSNIAQEQQFQKLAIENFKIAAASEKNAELKARFCYLTGELYRRIGDLKEARAWLEKTRAIKERPAFLDELMTEIEQRMAALE